MQQDILVGIIAGGVCVLLFYFYFIMNNNNSKPKKDTEIPKTTSVSLKVAGPYTKEEVAKHNHRDDVWIIIDGKVYDVTTYVDEHAGGDAILNNAGGDSSKGFHGPQHPASVYDVLAIYYIGDLIQ